MTNRGVIGIDKLKKDLQDLKEAEITVGYQGVSGAKMHPESEGASVAQVASYMEFGTKTIPARPFLRTALKQNKSEIKQAVRKALSDIIDQRADLDTAVSNIGEAAVEAIRTTIDNASSWAAPLAASTVKAKGSSSPLIDSGTMKDKASWAYRDNSGRIKKQGGEK